MTRPFNNTPSLRANHPTPARGEPTGKALVLFCEDQIRDYLYAIECGYVKENWKPVLANLRAELATALAADDEREGRPYRHHCDHPRR